MEEVINGGEGHKIEMKVTLPGRLSDEVWYQSRKILAGFLQRKKHSGRTGPVRTPDPVRGSLGLVKSDHPLSHPLLTHPIALL